MRQGNALRPPPPVGASRVASIPCAGMPSPLPRRDRERLSFGRMGSGMSRSRWQPSPQYCRVGSRIWAFRGLLGVHSRYGLPARRVTNRDPLIEDSDGFVTSTVAPTATGWNDQLPGGTDSR